jgi:uncharacterized protein (TIRG00374 family)
MNKNYRWLAYSVVLTILAAGAWIGYQDQAAIYAAVGRVGLQGFLFLLLFSSVNYSLRYLRWHYLMWQLGDEAGLWEGLLCYFSGFALTTTPAKAGEAVRALYFWRRRGIRYSHTLSCLLTERTMDALAAVLVGTLALYTFGHLRWIGAVLTLGIVGVVVFIGYHERLLGYLERLRVVSWRWYNRLLDGVPVFLARAKRQFRPRPLTVGVVIGVLAWSVEGVAFAWLVHRLGGEGSVLLYMSIFCIALVVGGLTFLPGGLGGTEVVMYGLTVASGLGGTEALTATLLIRLATLWYAVVLGLLAILWLESGGDGARYGPGASPRERSGG